MANDSKPISLYPLTPEEALRRAMRAPVPNKATLPPVKRAEKALPKAKKKAVRKKG